MKNEIIKRNILITSITSIVFLLLSFFIMSFSTYSSLKEELMGISEIVVSNIRDDKDKEGLREKVENFTDNQTWLNIAIADSDGVIFIDTNDDSIGYDQYGYLEEDELKLINNSLDTDRIYSNGSTIYYIEKVNNSVIIRTSTVYSANLTYILSGTFIMLILLIIEIVISYFSNNKTSNMILNTFSNITNNLKGLNKGEYEELDINSNFDEVEPIINEINSINNNINNSINNLKLEKNKLNGVLNKLDEGIIICSTDGKILLLNDKIKNMFNVDNNISLPKSYNNVFDNETLLNKIDESVSKNKNIFYDYKDDLSDKIYFVSQSYTKLQWDLESRRVLFITFTDVTTDRYSSNIKSNFIANASHELKTPITSIIGFSELLEANSKELDSRETKYVDTILSESKRMKELIEDLIYLSNLEYKEKEENKTRDKVYIKDEIYNIVNRLEANNKLNLTYTIDSDDCYIYSSLIDISRLLTNLIENATKYNKENGSVNISLKEHTNTIVLEVSDTGIGILPKDLDRIFERFYRVDKSRGGKVSGTGLGLNIVKEICDNLNAKIKVESEIDKGSTFKITFNKEI